MDKFNIFLRLLFCSLCVAAPLCAKEQQGEAFIVGTTSGYAPFVSIDSKGEYEGFDIDLARLIAEKLDRNLVIKDLGSMPGLMIGLKQGKVDALIWAISITTERLRQMNIIYYQGEKIATLPLLFWEKIPENASSLKDVEGSVCVEAGSYQEQVLRNYPGLTLKNVGAVTDAMMELKFGKSRAVAVDNALVPTLEKQTPELRVVYFPLPPDQQSLGNGICVNQNNPELAQQIRQAVEELTCAGKIAELEKKWGMGGS